jgi:hypothetical protein
VPGAAGRVGPGTLSGLGERGVKIGRGVEAQGVLARTRLVLKLDTVMTRLQPRDEGDGIVSRLKETADGLGQLVSDHVKLARIELVAEAKSHGRGVAVLAVAATVLVIGYAFAWTAAGLALATVVGAPLAFVIVAAPHLIAGLWGLVYAVRKMQQTRILPESAVEAARSVSALGQAARSNALTAP